MTLAAVTDSVAALREQVLDAVQEERALRIVGRGTWLDAGRPTRAVDSVSTRELSGITDYVPGDLTLTARAGTTLGELREATAAHGQWLALEPSGGDAGTLGATVATSSSGPLALSFGTPRDLTLGLEFITGAGVVARGGGRVVKNVAGFDLTRLLTGSWGSLGIITEVTVRLHARPECDETFAIGLDEDNAAGRVRQLTRRLPFTPYACEILNAALAAALLGREQIVALFRLGGNADAVRAQRAALAELGDAWQVDTAVWGALNDAEPKQAAVFRLSHRPSEVEGSWSEAAAISAGCRGTLLHASPARGIVRCIVPQSDESTAVLRRAFATPTQNTRVGERLPTELWPLASAPPVNDVISSRIKRAFDPASVLNPGILGDRAEDIA